MNPVGGRRGKGISARADRALDIAAGALSFSDGAEAVFDMPDAEVGRLIKQKAKELKRAVQTSAIDGGSSRPLTRYVSLKLPVEQSRRKQARLREIDFEARGQAYRQRLVTNKELLSPGEMQQTLNVTRQALSGALKTSRMFTVEVGGQTYYPKFFADGEVDRSVLEEISRALGDMPGWLKWDFFTSGRGSLGDASPLVALREGKAQEIERMAKALAKEFVG
jgi:hypothetical protein